MATACIANNSATDIGLRFRTGKSRRHARAQSHARTVCRRHSRLPSTRALIVSEKSWTDELES